MCYLGGVEKVDAQVKGGLHALLGNLGAHLSTYKRTQQKGNNNVNSEVQKVIEGKEREGSQQ